MKSLLLSLLLLVACSGRNDSPLSHYADASTWSYNQYAGKTISQIRYVQNGEMSGDVMLLFFTDGSTLRIYAYKYNMKVLNGGTK